MKTKKLRLGLLGTGVAANELYLPAFQQVTRELEVVACANRSRDKAEAFAARAGIPKVVDDAEQLFALPEVEAVLISLPIEVQPRYVLEALRAGKPVLSEKPVAPSVAAGFRLIRAASRYRVPWLVGENFAFMPHVLKLEQWVKEGRLGEVRWIEAVQATFMDANNPYFHTGWRKKPKHVGGFVVDGGVHLAEVVRRCFGVPVAVKGFSAQFERALPPLDTAVAALRFASGALGTWTSAFSVHYTGPMLRVHGSLATAEFFWGNVSLRQPNGKTFTFPPKPLDSFAEQFRHFADVVKRGKSLAFAPEDALVDLAFVETLVKSNPRRRQPSRRRAKTSSR